MNSTQLIETRRSIRKYENKEVSKENVQKLLKAVRWSPSWANTQCWEIISVSDNKIREALKAIISPKNPATEAVVSAPILFALCGKLEVAGYYKGKATTIFGDWFMHDLGIATQSLALAAHDMGLGTLIIGSFDHDKAKDILSVPKSYELATLICAGYPAQSPKPPKRKEVDEFIHYNRF